MKVSESEILRLEGSNAHLTRDNAHLAIEIDQLKSKLKSARDRLAGDLAWGPKTAAESPEIESIMHPAIVCERKVREGFRMCLTQGQGVISVALDSGFGLEVVPLHSPTETSSVPVHARQIRDLVPLADSVIASVSIDKTIALTSLESQSVARTIELDVALWCIAGMDENVIATGGDRGRLFLHDLRSAQEIFRFENPGPPVNSVVRLTDDLLMMTARNSHIYDFRRGSLTAITKQVEGGISLRGCPGSSFYSVLTRKENFSEICFGTFDDHARKFSVFCTQQIGLVKTMARPGLQIVNGIVHCAVPNEPSCDFSLFALSQPKHDLWADCKTRWVSHSATPVADLAITTETASILICSLSTDRLTLYELPMA
jgi:WD40 repeat protein